MNKNCIWKVFSKSFKRKRTCLYPHKLAQEPEPRAYNGLIYFNKKYLVRLLISNIKELGFFSCNGKTDFCTSNKPIPSLTHF